MTNASAEERLVPSRSLTPFYDDKQGFNGRLSQPSSVAWSLTDSLRSSSKDGSGGLPLAAMVQSGWSSVDSFTSGSSQLSPEQFRRLQAQTAEVRAENAALIKRNVLLDAKVQALTEAYQTLLDRIPDAARSIEEPEPLQQHEYPNVKYWTRLDWNSANGERVTDLENPAPAPNQRGRARAAQGINVGLQYVELADGTIISGGRATEVRRTARAIWIGLANKHGAPFASWGDADHDSRKTYFIEMGRRFPELRLCELDWKADLIATENYPAWRTNWMNKKASETRASNAEQSTSQVTPTDFLMPKRPFEGTDGPVDGTSKKPRSQAADHTKNHVPAIHVVPGTPNKSMEVTNVLLDHPNVLATNFPVANPLSPASPHLFAIDPSLSDMSSPQYPVTGLSLPIGGSPTWLPQGLPHVSEQHQALKQRKPARMRPSKSNTARDWVKENPKGTTDDFAAYYDSLTPEAKQKYEALSLQKMQNDPPQKEKSEEDKANDL